MSASDGEFAAMMYDGVENREKRDQRVQIVVQKLFRRGKDSVERTEGPSVDAELVQDAEIKKFRNEAVFTLTFFSLPSAP